MMPYFNHIVPHLFWVSGRVMICFFAVGRRRYREIIQQTLMIAYGSLPIVLLSTLCAGIVVTGEIGLHMEMALKTVDMVPGVTGQFIFREISIVIPALLLVAKTGASMSAEVSSMKITEQLDALILMKIDPIEYLVFPRFVASVLSTFCLTMMSIFVTLLCAMIYSDLVYHITYGEYFISLRPFLNSIDLLCAICKSVVFGAVVPLVACVYGFRCSGGADGVGKATTQSVVTSTTLIIVLDFFLTYAFSLLY